MPQQFLYRSQIGSAGKKMRGKRMTERMDLRSDAGVYAQFIEPFPYAFSGNALSAVIYKNSPLGAALYER
jgi:hypothetical protein